MCLPLRRIWLPFVACDDSCQYFMKVIYAYSISGFRKFLTAFFKLLNEDNKMRQPCSLVDQLLQLSDTFWF